MNKEDLAEGNYQTLRDGIIQEIGQELKKLKTRVQALEKPQLKLTRSSRDWS